MKKKSLPGMIIFVLLLAAVLAVLFNPGLIPFIGDETRELIRNGVTNTFSFKPGASGSTLLTRAVNVVAIIAFMMLCSTVLRFVLSRIKPRNGRSLTVLGLLQSMIKYAVALVMVIWVLSALGVNVTGIFASLGIISLVVGFGAQSLIEDIITGIFIIFEGQYSVGDIIVLDDFRGEVLRIGVRTTTIQDMGGNLKIVNNSDIRNFQNRSIAPSYAVTDVSINYGEDLPRVEAILTKEFPAMYERHSDLFLQAPSYSGVQSLSESSVVLRIVVQTAEKDYYAAFRALNREVLLCFAENGVEIPYNQLVVHTEN